MKTFILRLPVRTSYSFYSRPTNHFPRWNSCPSPTRQRRAGTTPTLGHNLCQDCQGYFFRRHGAKIQPDWRAHFFQLVFISSLFPQLVEHDVGSSLATNHPNVKRIRRDCCTQTVFILLVPASDDRDRDTSPRRDRFTHSL